MNKCHKKHQTDLFTYPIKNFTHFRIYVFLCVYFLLSSIGIDHLSSSPGIKGKSSLQKGKFFVSAQTMQGAPRECNATLIKDWYSSNYEGIMNTRSLYWEYLGVPMDKQQALILSRKWCNKKLQMLIEDNRGKYGPVTDIEIHRIMCDEACMEVDILSVEAMEATGCDDCTKLSTPPSDPNFRIEGDFCYGNSARILCHHLERCGVWNCRVGDFMCPRHEYNKLYIPYAGVDGAAAWGDCTEDAPKNLHIGKWPTLVLVGITTWLFYTMIL